MLLKNKSLQPLFSKNTTIIYSILGKLIFLGSG